MNEPSFAAPYTILYMQYFRIILINRQQSCFIVHDNHQHICRHLTCIWLIKFLLISRVQHAQNIISCYLLKRMCSRLSFLIQYGSVLISVTKHRVLCINLFFISKCCCKYCTNILFIIAYGLSLNFIVFPKNYIYFFFLFSVGILNFQKFRSLFHDFVSFMSIICMLFLLSIPYATGIQ